MSIFHWNNDQSKNTTVLSTPKTALDTLFHHVAGLVVQQEQTLPLTAQTRRMMSLADEHREEEAIKLYFAFETFIINHFPPTTVKQYSREELRAEIARVCDIHAFSIPLRLIFLPENEQAYLLFQLTLPYLAAFTIQKLGEQKLEEILTIATHQTSLEGLTIVHHTVHIPTLVQHTLAHMSLKELVLVLNPFYLAFYNEFKRIPNLSLKEEPLHRIFTFIKNTYPTYVILNLFLDIVPKELFMNESLEANSRQTIERTIQNKTAELQKTKDTLIKQVEAMNRQNQVLEDTKRAMLNLLEDIAEDKRRAEVGRAQDEAILASIGDGLIATNRFAKITLINTTAEALLGIKTAEVLGKAFVEVIPMSDETGTLLTNDNTPIALALQTGKKIFTTTGSLDTLYFIRKDKSKFPAVITTTPIRSGDNIIGSIITFHDATKEKEVDRMKTEFISLASHQLRTPLSAIKWFTEMLLHGDAGAMNGEQTEFAQNIWDSTNRMVELVNSLLNISRIESGRIIVDPVPTDIKELLETTIRDIKVKLDEKKQHLLISVHESLPKINIDPRLIHQVFLNLLTNAIKYTPENGDISIFISRKNDEIITQVTDTGFGIPADEQGSIFHRFFRASNAIKVETDGTGLGLYLIKAIIESSNGKIWFHSVEGKGTTFWFSLPLSGMVAKKGEVVLDS